MESVSPIPVIEKLSGASSTDCSNDESNGPCEGFDEGKSDKKQPWSHKKKHVSSGVADDVVVGVGGLRMDADLWPALSETTKVSSSKANSGSVKPHSNGSVSAPISQVNEIAAPSLKQGSNNKKYESAQTQASPPMRQKSIKRHGGSATANGVLAQPPSASGSSVEIAYSNNSSSTHRNSNLENGQRAVYHGGNGHPNPPNSVRRGNNGSYPRGDGSYNHNYGGRRDQDRQIRYSNRDGNMHPPGMPRSSIRPVPPPQGQQHVVPYFHHPIPPYAAPMAMGYHVPEMFGGMSFVPQIPPQPVYYYPIPAPAPAPSPVPAELQTKILNQIEYYFSEKNLIRDRFLRGKMDDEGWVPIAVIAGFNKIMEITDNIQLILDSIQSSTVVEVQLEKVRKRHDWAMFPRLSYGTNTLVNHSQNNNQENNAHAQAGSESSVVENNTR